MSTDRQVPACADRRRQAAIAFGAGLRSTRVSLGVSQTSLANLGELDPSFMSLLERGHRTPSFYVIVRLAEALEVSPIKLFAEGVARLPPGNSNRGVSTLYRLAYRKADHLIEIGPGYPDLTALTQARTAFAEVEPTHVVEYIRSTPIKLTQR